MELGADDFLNKPIDQIELIVRVKSNLRIKHYHDQLISSNFRFSKKNEELECEIIKRKSTEEALRQSEEKYRLLVNHAPAGIYEVDIENTKFISVKDIMCEYTGYSREKFLDLEPIALKSMCWISCSDSISAHGKSNLNTFKRVTSPTEPSLKRFLTWDNVHSAKSDPSSGTKTFLCVSLPPF
jgi:hypothetical protein